MTRTLPLLAATAALLLSAPVAAAQSKATLTVRGAGFGHGVGMSQYGALGFAQHGATAPDILAHYYTGTELGTTDPNRDVRVQLVAETRSARITGARRAGKRKLDPSKTYTVTRAGLTQLQLSTGGRRVATFAAPLQVTGEVTQYSGHGSYRGVLEFAPTVFKGFSVVNSVSLENYLRGVVPAEVPASWPAEALKTQAIAARTYAITTAKSDAFDHYADTRSQVYNGAGAETDATDAAIADTRGQVVTYDGEPVVTYFFSTSGGRTEDVENTSLGTDPVPWLKSVEDPYDDVSPRHRWTIRLPKASAAKKLGGLVKGTFKGIRVTKRGVSPRIVTADVIGSRGTTTTDGATLRARLGLYDTWASFTAISARAAAADPSGGIAAPPRSFSFALFRPPVVGTLRGTVVGPPRGTLLRVQIRRAGGWQDVGTTRTRRDGTYRYDATERGRFRVLADGAAGPSVRVG